MDYSNLTYEEIELLKQEKELKLHQYIIILNYSKDILRDIKNTNGYKKYIENSKDEILDETIVYEINTGRFRFIPNEYAILYKKTNIEIQNLEKIVNSLKQEIELLNIKIKLLNKENELKNNIVPFKQIKIIK